MAEFTEFLEYKVIFRDDDWLELDSWFSMMTIKSYSDYVYNMRFQ